MRNMAVCFVCMLPSWFIIHTFVPEPAFLAFMSLLLVPFWGGMAWASWMRASQ